MEVKKKEKKGDSAAMYPFASDLLYGQVPHEGVLGPQIEKHAAPPNVFQECSAY